MYVCMYVYCKRFRINLEFSLMRSDDDVGFDLKCSKTCSVVLLYAVVELLDCSSTAH